MSDCSFFQIHLAEQKMKQKMMDVAMPNKIFIFIYTGFSSFSFVYMSVTTL